MSLTTRIEQDYIAAYKAKDALRLGVLRLLKTAAKNLQVELMRPVTDEELATVIQKQAKQRPGLHRAVHGGQSARSRREGSR